MVAAKCTQCGSNIEVDNTKEAGICSHCGTAFITEKVIKNYNTYVTQSVTKNIYGREKTEADEYLANGETFLTLKDWGKAIKAFGSAAEANPSNFRGWFGLARAETAGFTDLSNSACIGHIEKALAVANDKEKEIVNSACSKYLENRENYKQAKVLEYVEKVKQSSVIGDKVNGWQARELRAIIVGMLTVFFGGIMFLIGLVFLIVFDFNLWFLLLLAAGLGLLGVFIGVGVKLKKDGKKHQPLSRQFQVLYSDIEKLRQYFLESGNEIPEVK